MLLAWCAACSALCWVLPSFGDDVVPAGASAPLTGAPPPGSTQQPLLGYSFAIGYGLLAQAGEPLWRGPELSGALLPSPRVSLFVNAAWLLPSQKEVSGILVRAQGGRYALGAEYSVPLTASAKASISMSYSAYGGLSYVRWQAESSLLQSQNASSEARPLLGLSLGPSGVMGRLSFNFSIHLAAFLSASRYRVYANAGRETLYTADWLAPGFKLNLGYVRRPAEARVP